MRAIKSIKKLVKLALCNDMEAQYRLASWFREQDILPSACYWFDRAAQQGHLESMLIFKILMKKMARDKKVV